MMKNKFFVLFSVMTLCCIFLFAANTFADDKEVPRKTPKRLASIGDSIVEAIDAEVYGANHWASWANGYHGFWQWLFGLSNVNSHNQLITQEFGRRGRKNYLEAESGADSFDLPGQAAQAVAHDATYVPWLMGHNDICQDYEEDITKEEHFETNVRQALEILRGLPPGATIYVVGMVDVPKLYEEAQHKKALGIVDCEVLWFFTLFELFPCGTVLGPLRTDEDRDRMHDRIEGNCKPGGAVDCSVAGDNFYEGFNPILKRLVGDFDREDSSHYYFYTDTVFDHPFVESDVSDLDCFHPSPEGQALLSEITWIAEDGPQF